MTTRSLHAAELPSDVLPTVTIASTTTHGPGADLYHLEWAGRPWRSLPRLVRATEDERRCGNPYCRQTYPCDGFVRRSSWPY